MEITGLTAQGRLKTPIDITQIEGHRKGKGDFFIGELHITATSSGFINISNAKWERQIKSSADAIIRELKKRGAIDANWTGSMDLFITSYIAHANLKQRIDLVKFTKQNSDVADYEPEISPYASYYFKGWVPTGRTTRFGEPKQELGGKKAQIFSTGKIQLMGGFENTKDLEECYAALVAKIREV
jgi:TATA-box binding protein (TBP) (component of TFIID and TFIIIB)